MNKEDLIKLKENLNKLNSDEKTKRDLYLRLLAIGKIQGPSVGVPSVDKPWLKNYPEFLFKQRKKYNKIISKLKDVWNNENEEIINYYDNNITVKELFNKISSIARSLNALGIKKGSSLVSSLESVPEFIELILACEMIGCSIKNYIGEADDIIDLINNDSNTLIYIAPNYLKEEDSNKIYNSTNIKHIITIDPLYSIKNKNVVRKNILEEINSKYKNIVISNDDRDMEWNKFLNIGINQKDIEYSNENNILFSGFTSGSTGKPKEVRHTSASVMGIIEQMSLFPSNEKERDTWLLTILPPTLVAIVVAMIFYPLCDGKKLILDPYCKLDDVDLEMMHYEPNCWGCIPIFFDKLLASKRIPENYDMSYFKLFGFGAEPLKSKFVDMVQKFLDLHNCNAPLSSGYGQSEGGSDFTIAMGKDMIISGASGIPLIDTTISIFEPNSSNELGYNQIGEICKMGPGIMAGYATLDQTEEVLKVHDDGNVWLHTRDYGYITPDGILFALGRSGIKVYPNKTVFPLGIENKILLIDGLKDAIIVSGRDKQNPDYELPYLFVIPDENINIEELLNKINEFIKCELLEEEKPADIFVIDEKPISKFKTDRKTLQKKYNLI